MTTIDKAVQKALDDITDAQIACRLLYAIDSFIRDKRSLSCADKDFSRAFGVISQKLYEELNKSWEQLSWFGTVDLRAKEALHKRAKTWFEKKDHEVMSFIGESGSYYIHDEKAFRKSLADAFGFDEEE